MTGKQLLWVLVFFLQIGIVAAGCAPARIDPYARAPQKMPPREIPPERAQPQQAPPEAGSPEKFQTTLPGKVQPDPRTIASVQLTEQGRMLLEQGLADDAITVFEQALNLSPDNGRNYYYLAEAWLAKGEIRQAREWNRLAALYLQDDPAWAKKVSDQKARINAKF